MLKTIMQGSCVMVQGIFVRGLPGGRIVVRVGKTEYAGAPVGPKAA